MPLGPDTDRLRVALLVALALLSTAGCVRRRLTVRSNPPGALVHVDNQKIGVTPCSVDYVYYGTREIRLSAPGYETLTVNQPLPPPWYQLPGIDFVSENLVPGRIEDARTVSFNLQRARLEPAEQVIARGEELRRQLTPVGAAPVVPAGATVDPFGGLAPGLAPVDPPPVVRGAPLIGAASPSAGFATPAFGPPPGATAPFVLPPAPDAFRY